MAAVEIMQDLFFLERGYLNANHFVYRSRQPILIDTGYRADFDETERLISRLGVRISDIAMIICTHCHCDHIGGNKIIQDRSGCNIALHPMGKYFIETGDDWSTWWRYYRQEADFFNCSQALEDGAEVFIGPHVFRVIHTPGHAADGIVLYNPKEKVLFSSDALWSYDIPVITVRIEGSTAVHEFERTLQKLALLDVAVVYPGHGQPFTDFKEALKRSRRKIQGYLLDREKIGNDLLKKIVVYTLLMKQSVPEDLFYQQLRETMWYKETVDLYFNGEYEAKYKEILHRFIERGVVKRKDDHLVTTVKA